jgi:hypothetical protein
MGMCSIAEAGARDADEYAGISAQGSKALQGSGQEKRMVPALRQGMQTRKQRILFPQMLRCLQRDVSLQSL